MSAPPKSEWCSMCCSSEYDFSAIRSWFGPLVPEEWGNPLKADILQDCSSDRTLKMRVLFRRPDGSLREATRTVGRRFTIKVASPSAGILKGFTPPDPSVPPKVVRAEAGPMGAA